MDKMDASDFLEIANQVSNVKMYPYFDIAHSVLSAVAVREDLGEGARAFSQKHPFSCWLSYMMVVCAGSMVVNGLLGEPILASLKNNQQMLIATISWYLVFYAPGDIGYKISNFLPLKLMFSAMKEVYRTKNIYAGMSLAIKMYPEAYLIIVTIGTIRGNGAGFAKLAERLIRGVWTPKSTEFMQPSFPTKASIVASIIILLNLKTDLIPVPPALLHFGIVILFIYFKLSSILLGIQEPLKPFENLLSAIFFGGHWNSMTKVFGQSPSNKRKHVEAKKD